MRKTQLTVLYNYFPYRSMYVKIALNTRDISHLIDQKDAEAFPGIYARLHVC